mgnify:CR=1 FL=1|jgi:hypothetical protein
MTNYFPIKQPGYRTGPITDEWNEKVREYINEHPLFLSTDIHKHFGGKIIGGRQNLEYSRVARAIKLLKLENFIVMNQRFEKAIQYKKVINP